jgi:acyl-CoA reductase-like NAD-dependent aldehyde dehydrogenase
MPAHYRHFIAGQWVESSDGSRFSRENPATGELLATFASGGPAEVAAAVAAARAAFNDWRLTPAPRRGEILFRAGQLLIERKEALAREMTAEMGKVLAETRGDVQEAIDMTFYMAGEGRRLWGQTTPSELPNKWNMSQRRPLGVVGLVTPWNFPMAIPAWKLMPALIAGNTVVFKPATYTPLLAIRLVEILTEAGLPPGVVNLVLGSGPSAGDAIVRHPDVALISFTGSTEVGRTVAVEGARHGKRVALEMGGKNAIVVMDDANVDLAVEGAVWSAFGTSGQRCTAASRLIVHRDVQRPFTDRLLERVSALRLGNGLEPDVDVGPVVSRAQLERVHRYIDIGQGEGARVAVGGAIVRDGALGSGYFHQPTVFVDVRPGMRVAQEEIFGPVTSVIGVDSLEAAIEAVNGVAYGLSASIYTTDINRAFRYIRDIHTGVLYVNAGTIGAEIHLPFGGTKATGNGHREAGQAALDTYTEWQSIYIDYSGRLQKAQIDTTAQ